MSAKVIPFPKALATLLIVSDEKEAEFVQTFRRMSVKQRAEFLGQMETEFLKQMKAKLEMVPEVRKLEV